MKTHIKSSNKQINSILKVISECFKIITPEWDTMNCDPVEKMKIHYGDTPFVRIRESNFTNRKDRLIHGFWSNTIPPLVVNDFEFAAGDYIQIPINYFEMTEEQIKKELENKIKLSSFEN